MGRTEGPLATELPPGGGRREVRYAHLLAGAPAAEPARSAGTDAERGPVSPDRERIERIERRLAEVEAELARLKDQLAQLL
jgi:hypothetical protein